MIILKSQSSHLILLCIYLEILAKLRLIEDDVPSMTMSNPKALNNFFDHYIYPVTYTSTLPEVNYRDFGWDARFHGLWH